MQTRKIGAEGFEVSCLALGAMGYGALKDRGDLIRVIRTAVDRGVSLIDTAEVYGPEMHAHSARRGEGECPVARLAWTGKPGGS